MLKLIKEHRKTDNKDHLSILNQIKMFLVIFWDIFLRKLGFEHKPPDLGPVPDLVVPLATCLKKKGKSFYLKLFLLVFLFYISN